MRRQGEFNITTERDERLTRERIEPDTARCEREAQRRVGRKTQLLECATLADVADALKGTVEAKHDALFLDGILRAFDDMGAKLDSVTIEDLDMDPEGSFDQIGFKVNGKLICLFLSVLSFELNSAHDENYDLADEREVTISGHPPMFRGGEGRGFARLLMSHHGSGEDDLVVGYKAFRLTPTEAAHWILAALTGDHSRSLAPFHQTMLEATETALREHNSSEATVSDP